MHFASHCFSCGHTRPHTAGKALVSFSTLAASRNSPRSMFLMKVGIWIPTGQPSIQVGFAQSRHRSASAIACSAVSPKLTSSFREWLLYSASNSGMCTRDFSPRSLAFMVLRSSSLHGSLRRACIYSCSVIFSRKL